MSTKPILVVHGIANHDKRAFEVSVAKLQDSIKSDLPDVSLIPVFWGDLGGASVDIADCLPRFQDGRWTTRAEGLLAIKEARWSEEVRSELMLTNEQRARIIAEAAVQSMHSPAVRSELDVASTICEALDSSVYLQQTDDTELLNLVGSTLAEAITDEFPSPDAGTFEVRGEATVETRGWIADRIKGVVSGLDKVVGRLVEDRLGVVNQRLRESLMNGVAATLGDVIAYDGHKGDIQRRLWDAIGRAAPGYGTATRPIGVIAHSLGGVISYDVAVAPASEPALHIDSFVTFGTQPAFFEVVSPRRPQLATYRAGHPITLPATIRRWFNLWDVVDLLAFTAGTVFRLSDGSKPEDISVEDPFSVMLDERLWLHSVYWTAAALKSVLVRAFG